MNRRMFLGTLAILSTLGALSCTKRAPESPQPTGVAAVHQDPEGYYTCPMHPQVHQHDPGNCPICGMALVKVSGEKQETKPEVVSSHELHTTENQLALAGIGKYTVTRKDMTFTVPVSGRQLSSREIAFQVFESDLQVVKAGLQFSGSTSLVPSEKLNGQVRSVDSLVDPSSRTVRVIGVLAEPPKRSVLEGGFHGEITATETSQIAIPEEAVLHTGLGQLVYVISPDNKLRPLKVALGKKAKGEYQVLSGLKEGDVISTGPNFLIDSEAKIRGGNDQTHN